MAWFRALELTYKTLISKVVNGFLYRDREKQVEVIDI
jgi:hypothetical protein